MSGPQVRRGIDGDPYLFDNAFPSKAQANARKKTLEAQGDRGMPDIAGKDVRVVRLRDDEVRGGRRWAVYVEEGPGIFG